MHGHAAMSTHLRVDSVLLCLVGCRLVIEQRCHRERWEDATRAIGHEALRDERRLHDLSELDRRRWRRVQDEADGDCAGGQHCCAEEIGLRLAPRDFVSSASFVRGGFTQRTRR